MYCFCYTRYCPIKLFLESAFLIKISSCRQILTFKKLLKLLPILVLIALLILEMDL